MPRNPKEKRSVSWESRFGTTHDGNLPQYKRGQNLCGIDPSLVDVMEGVKLCDFHYYHIKCPYSTEALYHYVRNTDLSSEYYWEMELLPPSSFFDHLATKGIMIKRFQGSKSGWLCVDNNCPYYLSTGRRYFYV